MQLTFYMAIMQVTMSVAFMQVWGGNFCYWYVGGSLFQLCMWLFLLQAVRNFCSTYADDSFFGKYVGSNFYCNFADVSLCCNYTGGTFAVYCAPDCFYCNYKGDSFIAM